MVVADFSMRWCVWMARWLGQGGGSATALQRFLAGSGATQIEGEILRCAQNEEMGFSFRLRCCGSFSDLLGNLLANFLPGEFGAELDVARAAGTDYWVGGGNVGSGDYGADVAGAEQVVVHGEDVEIGMV